MNIGIVVHHFDATDGTGGYAVQLVRRLAQDHDVTLYAAVVRTEVPPEVTLVPVPRIGTSAYSRILSFPLAFARLRKQHDLVHAQGWVTPKAEVVTTHIVLEAWRRAAQSANIIPPLGERLCGGFVARRERGLIKRAKIVIAPSFRAANDVRSVYGRENGIRTIHHGFPAPMNLPSKLTARNRLGLPPDEFVLLYAGDARKGLDRVLTALVGIPDVRLLVASRSRANVYEERAGQIGVAHRVHWAGALSDMSLALAAVDALVHPTVYDTFAMVVAEAMANRVPVIVSPHAGIVDLITHAKSGWILDSGCSDLDTAICSIKDNGDLAYRLANGGEAVAKTRSWDDVARETVAAYRDVLSS